jgi:hypothetical protein
MDTSTGLPDSRHAQAQADHIGRMGSYLYQIRNMLAWMLVLWVISVAAAAGVGIYLGVHGSPASSSSSSCLSQGGTDSSC